MTERPTALQALADAGVPLDAIGADHLAALASLDDNQLAAVVGVLEVVVPEVEGFAAKSGKKKAAPAPMAPVAPAMLRGGTGGLGDNPGLGDLGNLGNLGNLGLK